MIVLLIGMVWLAVGLTSCGAGSSDIPPPAAQETVAGIDANGDGVRDDIEAYIDTTYPPPAQSDINRVLRQFARAAQATMIDASEPAPSVTHGANRNTSIEEKASHGSTNRPELTGCAGYKYRSDINHPISRLCATHRARYTRKFHDLQ